MKTSQKKELDMKKAIKRYNDLMDSLCMEYNTIGTRLSEDTDNWNLRDMVSECQYVLDCCYEEGNSKSDGRYPEYWAFTAEDILDKNRYDRVVRHNNEEKEEYKRWLSRTRRLKNFINAYEPYIKDMKCATGHCSKFDN